MLTAYGKADAPTLKRKARAIELQAARSSPILAAQLRALADQYYEEADSLQGVTLRHLLSSEAVGSISAR